MEVLYPCCCGIDVHKKSVTACVQWAEGRGKVRKEKRRFSTFTQDLEELASWLQGCGVTHVAMESTGVYWKPVYNVLEGRFELLVVNAQHIKAVPGARPISATASGLQICCSTGCCGAASFHPGRRGKCEI